MHTSDVEVLLLAVDIVKQYYVDTDSDQRP